MYRAQPWNSLCAMVRGVEATKREFAQAPALRGDIPLSVLSAETTAGSLPSTLGLSSPERWRSIARAAHQRLAQRSSRGTWRLVPGSGHLIAGDKPQVVVDEVLALIDSFRPRQTAN